MKNQESLRFRMPCYRGQRIKYTGFSKYGREAIQLADNLLSFYTLRRFVLLPSQVNSTFLSSQNVSRCTFLPHSATR